MKFVFLFVVLALNLSCQKNDSRIIIVDIGHLDRNGIAKQLNIVNACSPRVVALDFLLTTDSLEKDYQLEDALIASKNLVHTVTLHQFNDTTQRWDSLETYHYKFKQSRIGFANITINDDSVLVKELPMMQYHGDIGIPAFSLSVANGSGFEIEDRYEFAYEEDLYFSEHVFHPFKVIKSQDLLSGNFSKEDLKDKIVMMGVADGTEDVFFIDRGRTKKLSGVEIQASLVEEILK